jgi:hypothetical protein
MLTLSEKVCVVRRSGRLTAYPEVTPKKYGYVRVGDNSPGTQANGSSMSVLACSQW